MQWLRGWAPVAVSSALCALTTNACPPALPVPYPCALPVPCTSRHPHPALGLSSDSAGTHPSLARTAAGAAWPTAVIAYDAGSRQLKPTALGSALPQALFTVSLDEAAAALRAAVPAEAAGLDLADPAVAALVAEVGGFLVIVDRIANDAASAPLVADKQADMLTLSLAALAPLKADAAAKRLVDAALPKLLAAYGRVWGAAARSQLVLTPADTDVDSSARSAAAEGWTVVGAHAFAPAAVTHAAKLAACSKFAAAVEGSSTVAHCVAATGGNRRRLASELPTGSVSAAACAACLPAQRERTCSARRNLLVSPCGSRCATLHPSGRAPAGRALRSGGLQRHCAALPEKAASAPLSPSPRPAFSRSRLALVRPFLAAAGHVHERPARAFPGDSLVVDPADRDAAGWQLRALQHAGHRGLAALLKGQGPVSATGRGACAGGRRTTRRRARPPSAARSAKPLARGCARAERGTSRSRRE